MNERILLLGHTGKMGIALKEVFEEDYDVIGKNSSDFDALDFEQIQDLIEKNNPDIVINTVAFLGIDHCEEYPEKAFGLNALYPKLLAELSNTHRFLLIHFSTDAVFDGEKGDFYSEEDCPRPLNMYGLTKYGGDRFVQVISRNYYLLRISLLFGGVNKKTQFVEKMLQKAKEGERILRVSDDIVLSPTYSRDVAEEAKRILEASLPFGLYHIANSKKGSLYDLIKEIVDNLHLDVKVEKASYRDFPHLGAKNTYTPLRSEKIKPLRPWKEAVAAYCHRIINQC
ncbi:MAG TPA: NAD(P)-dependent oxidoreductase [Candidatus Scalindua sp.]|nr:NAD(P)-dependent oxidoreductase [Candidatus Scalindua sp.]